MPHSTSLKTRQGGAALVVGLVLLLILTLLGVSGLGTATTEVRLADNNKQREFAFQAVESGVNEAIRGGGLLIVDAAMLENAQVRNPSEFVYDHTNADRDVPEANIAVTVDTLYRGVGDIPGESGSGFSAAYDSDVFAAVHFVAHGEANGQRGARARVRRGFYIPGPRP